MDVRWEEAGWERLAPGVGRRRMPVWDATVGLVTGVPGSEVHGPEAPGSGVGGALLIDTGSSLREGAELRAQAQGLLGPGRRVTHIALTHPHFDHVLGTAAFAGAEVYGAVGVDRLLRRDRDVLRDDAVRHGVERVAAAEAADVLVAPHHTVSGEWTLDLGGGRQVLLANVGPAHSGHDLVVLVPGSPEVVFCGDLVEESGTPQAGPDAHPSQWPAALDRLLARGGEDAVYVPGHGAVVDAAYVRAQRDALAARFDVS